MVVINFYYYYYYYIGEPTRVVVFSRGPSGAYCDRLVLEANLTILGKLTLLTSYFVNKAGDTPQLNHILY